MEGMSGAREPTPGSRDEGFAAWLAMNAYLVEEDFLVFDVDGMPDDPFGEDGLRVAEAEALRRFTDYHEALAAPNRELFDKFVRFLGETFVRGIGGEWTNRPHEDDGNAYLGVRFPWTEYPLTIPTMVTAALARRTGEEWAFVYRCKLKDRDAADHG
jgi:hypothetical protein